MTKKGSHKRYFNFLIGVVFVFILTEPAFSEDSYFFKIPQDQIRFENIIRKNLEEFKKKISDGEAWQQQLIKNNRKVEFSRLLKFYQVDSWVGRIEEININPFTVKQDGVVLIVKISPFITLKAYQVDPLYVSEDLKAQHISLYDSLIKMKKGQRVKFSGKFYPSLKNFIEELSVNMYDSMTKPVFTFNFSKIAPYRYDKEIVREKEDGNDNNVIILRRQQ